MKKLTKHQSGFTTVEIVIAVVAVVVVVGIILARAHVFASWRM